MAVVDFVPQTCLLNVTTLEIYAQKKCAVENTIIITAHVICGAFYAQNDKERSNSFFHKKCGQKSRHIKAIWIWKSWFFYVGYGLQLNFYWQHNTNKKNIKQTTLPTETDFKTLLQILETFYISFSYLICIANYYKKY